jgi:uncharacterized protein YdeI (YjbR/CyaY-like superfamily)
VKVPYAKKWQTESDKLRKIALDCDLSEEMKWGKPCFTYQEKNVAIVIPLKDACALSFFMGALLKDPKHILQKVGEHTQAGRWIKFTSVKEITAVQSILRSYLQEAIKVEESGKKVTLKKASEYAVPEELQARLDATPKLRAAFEALTPGRRKSCHGCEAGEDAGGAGGEVCAYDHEWARVQRVHRLNIRARPA